MEQEKIGFFRRIKMAIFNLEDYDLFAVESTKKAFSYFIKFMLLFVSIVSIGITYKFATSYEEMALQYNMQDLVSTIETMKNENEISFYVATYISVYIYCFVAYVIFALADALLLSVIGMLTSRIARVVLKYGPVFNISIYALTLPMLLNAAYIVLNSFTGFEIKYFEFMYNAIAYIYVVTAILMIRSEMIKQELELMQLEEEQKRVREELKRQEEEEKQKEEQRRREREKEKKEKEKEKQEKPSRRNARRF